MKNRCISCGADMGEVLTTDNVFGSCDKPSCLKDMRRREAEHFVFTREVNLNDMRMQIQKCTNANARDWAALHEVLNERIQGICNNERISDKRKDMILAGYSGALFDVERRMKEASA